MDDLITVALRQTSRLFSFHGISVKCSDFTSIDDLAAAELSCQNAQRCLFGGRTLSLHFTIRDDKNILYSIFYSTKQHFIIDALAFISDRKYKYTTAQGSSRMSEVTPHYKSLTACDLLLKA